MTTRRHTVQARRVSPAAERLYRWLEWLIPTLDKFPRSQRFLLGDRIEHTALDLLERLIEATYTREPVTLLRQANLAIEKLRVLLRLAKDLRYLDFRCYEFGQSELDEIGRLVGGWMKAGRATAVAPEEAGNGAPA